jgi:hypothetical protein
VPVDAECFGDGIGCFTCRHSPCYLVPKLPRDSRPSNALALCPGSSHSGSSALGYLLRTADQSGRNAGLNNAVKHPPEHIAVAEALMTGT